VPVVEAVFYGAAGMTQPSWTEPLISGLGLD